MGAGGVHGLPSWPAAPASGRPPRAQWSLHHTARTHRRSGPSRCPDDFAEWRNNGVCVCVCVARRGEGGGKSLQGKARKVGEGRAPRSMWRLAQARASSVVAPPRLSLPLATAREMPCCQAWKAMRRWLTRASSCGERNPQAHRQGDHTSMSVFRSSATSSWFLFPGHSKWFRIPSFGLYSLVSCRHIAMITITYYTIKRAYYVGK